MRRVAPAAAVAEPQLSRTNTAIEHDTKLIAMMAVGFGLAFALGLAARRLRVPPLVGYLLAGIAVGPFTPGFVGDAEVAGQLAEIGVILLMFGVGLHFSPRELLAVRKISLPGAVVQIVTATAMGADLTFAWGWSWGAGLVFGLALSVASTVVLLRALEEGELLSSADGRIAVGWLIVEDLAMILALVLLPALSEPLGGASRDPDGPGLIVALGAIFARLLVFLVLMFFVGRRIAPWLLIRVARTGSRELFTLGVLALSIGIAVGAAALFGVSLALGAFLAGVVISESHISRAGRRSRSCARARSRRSTATRPGPRSSGTRTWYVLRNMSLSTQPVGRVRHRAGRQRVPLRFPLRGVNAGTSSPTRSCSAGASRAGRSTSSRTSGSCVPAATPNCRRRGTSSDRFERCRVRTLRPRLCVERVTFSAEAETGRFHFQQNCASERKTAFWRYLTPRFW